jgi:hypothetical protein
MMKGEKNKELLFLKKKILELLPSILAIRNPNWSQSLNKRTDCV